MPAIRPMHVAGRDCWSAGVFLTLRSHLVNDDVPEADILPSTPLREFTSIHRAEFFWAVARVAPLAPLFPNLNGQKPEYLMAQLKAFRDGKRTEPTMVPMAMPLSDQDIADLASFYGGLK